MPFDASAITEIFPPETVNGVLLLRWSSSAPDGTIYQVYFAGKLAWSGEELSCILPAPATKGRFVIGAVGPGEASTDYSAELAVANPRNHADLAWKGGTYLGADIASFRVYGSSSPGSAVDETRILAEIPAYSAGIITDGFGQGGFGEGGFGASSASYSWRSGMLAPGDWTFKVKSVDVAGNEQNAAQATITIIGPPGPPARDSQGDRLDLSYNPGSHVASLSWLPPE